MTMIKVVPALVLGVSLSLGGALEAQDPPPAGTVEIERYQIGTALPPTQPGREMVSFTLQEAIDRALAMNLDIQTARLAPEIQGYTLLAAQAAFSPTLTTTFGQNSSTQAVHESARWRGQYQPPIA